MDNDAPLQTEPRTLVVSSEFLGRTAREFATRQMTRPAMVVSIVVLAVGASWLLSSLLDLDVVVILIALLVIPPLFGWFGSRFSTRKALERAYPVGSTISFQLTPDGVAIAAALGTQEVHDAAFRRVATTRTLVLLRVRGSLNDVVVPRALVSDDELALLTARIAASGS